MGNREKRQRRAKEKKKQNAIERQRRSQQQNEARDRFADRFNVSMTPDALAMCGPLVTGAWAVSEPTEQALRSSGRPVPVVVSGHFLVDTGATSTCIALDVAESDLKLHPSGTIKTHGSLGSGILKTFHVKFLLNIEDQDGNRSTIERTMQAAGIADLEKGFEPLGLNANGVPVRVIGLIGRDFLRHCTMTYRGADGRVDFRIHPEGMNRMDSPRTPPPSAYSSISPSPPS